MAILLRAQIARFGGRLAPLQLGIRPPPPPQNLTMRMGMRRFARLTNGFSKKVENLAHAVSLHYRHYNSARPHKTFTKANNGYPTTPAMAAGVADHVWTLTELAALLD